MFPVTLYNINIWEQANYLENKELYFLFNWKKFVQKCHLEQGLAALFVNVFDTKYLKLCNQRGSIEGIM